MAGRQKFSELTKDWSPARRARVEAEKRKLLAEIRLAELRESRDVTQKELAELLEMDQGNISKLERRENVQIGTLRRYIEALGGTLEIVAHFRDGDYRIATPSE
jgi:transcriptional regulator with XRE-family HTH domain